MRIFSLKLYVLVIVVGLFSVLAFTFFSQKRTIFLPGQTSNSHHLIETSCNSCHLPFKSVPNDNCNKCHKKDLEQDSHSEAKLLDAKWDKKKDFRKTKCSDCHFEHTGRLRPITVKQEFCFSCHQQIVTEKENHKNFANTSCWTSGCHNYHNNTVLKADFIKEKLAVDPSDLTFAVLELSRESGEVAQANHPTNLDFNKDILTQWQESYHAQTSVNCMSCHEGAGNSFVKQPEQAVCVKCHSIEFNGFQESSHGIRTYLNLSPLVQKDSRLPMKLKEDEHRKMGCFICHDVHSVNIRQAAVESCLKCHNDTHSQKYLESKHSKLFAPEDKIRAGSQAVTCATCHMPRVEVSVDGKEKVIVNHNNSSNLRPRDKMLKVCLSCHDFEFSFNSIFDDKMVKENFIGTPTKKHDTMKIFVP